MRASFLFLVALGIAMTHAQKRRRPPPHHQHFNNQHCVNREMCREISRTQDQQIRERESLGSTTNLDSKVASSCFLEVVNCGGVDARYRTADGTCNNRKYSHFGRPFSTFKRFMDPNYAGDEGLVTGRPNPRAISLSINQVTHTESTQLSLMAMQFGQFLDHDITHTPLKNSDVDCCNAGIQKTEPDCESVPILDPSGPLGTSCMHFMRSFYVTETLIKNVCRFISREQVNQITSFVDASNIYGSDESKMSELRSKTDSAKLQVSSGDLLPRDTANCGTVKCFKAGDDRVNEQVDLTVMHTIFMREHNNIVDKIRAVPGLNWDNERIFKEARKIMAAMMQTIVYKEYLPAILGEDFVRNSPTLNIFRNAPYNPEVNPGIFNEFATAAFRFGHSQIQGQLPWPGNDPIDLTTVFSNPSHLDQGGSVINELLTGLISEPSMATDNKFVDQITNRLFEASDGTALDLLALNIQRGRDHGLPSYQKYKTNFTQTLNGAIPSSVQALLNNVYGDGEIDLYIGGISESNARGAAVGPLFREMMARQFTDLRIGDGYFFTNGIHYSKAAIDQIRQKTSLAAIMCRNAGFTNIKRLVMLSGNSNIPCSLINDELSLNTEFFEDPSIPTTTSSAGAGSNTRLADGGRQRPSGGGRTGGRRRPDGGGSPRQRTSGGGRRRG